jgi:pyrimidine deaminase RibD-like protein
MNEGERKYMEEAIALASKSKPEDKHRPHPKVGAVIIHGDKIVGSYRGETEPGTHAEYSLTQLRLGGEFVSGSTLYTTLEPCTTRKHPKVPCADRIADRGIARVIIGMLDPNPTISGKGILRLREKKIQVELFPPDLMAKVEELNNEFIRFYRPIHAGIISGSVPADPTERSLDDWYRIINVIYEPRNFYREPASIFMHLVEIIGGLGALALEISPNAKRDLIQEYVPKALGWWMSLCGRVGVTSVQKMLWGKFPGICPYCEEPEHLVKKCRPLRLKKAAPRWDFLQEKASDTGAMPKTLEDWQHMLARIYPVREGEDYRDTLRKLTEELGELAEAVRAVSIKPGYFLNEAADVFTWIVRLMTIYQSLNDDKKTEKDLKLGELFAARYPDRCFRCQNQQCSCPPIQPETLGKIAEQMPLYKDAMISPDKVYIQFEKTFRKP